MFCKRECIGQTDSAENRVDSAQHIDSGISLNKKATIPIDFFLKKNKYLNTTAAPVSFISKEKVRSGKESIFYILAALIFLLGVFKVFYAKYFNNIFRVFFNTSLRQSQLTDLLLQSKLPSLIFNIFFIINLGIYVWLLINYFSSSYRNNYLFAGLSVFAVAILYIGKFISIKVLGWASGMSDAADQYIFVIFLINKIIGILLIPFIVLIAFAPANWLPVILIGSYLLLGLLFLMRYLRSYGLLQNRLSFSRFHFLLYIVGAEVLPLIILYKLLISVINKENQL